MVADALSRPTEFTEDQFLVLFMPHFLFLDQLRKSLHDSPEFSLLLAYVFNNPNVFPLYVIHNDFLLYDGKLWLNLDNPFIRLLLDEFHITPLGGHMGFVKTLAHIQGNFYWKGMHSTIRTFVFQCPTCQ